MPIDPIQDELMEERIALLDAHDNVIGAGSKRECHLRTSKYPDGRLHRAFSVFLFDSENRLLLQRRAAQKITFPNMWTNTCCSHPLHCEQELAPGIGIKRAAIRKLDHELGINGIRPEMCRYLTRIEYKAYMEPGPWIEHEIDYILFARHDVNVAANVNEVSDTRYVSKDVLRDLLTNRDLHEYKFTPWFDLICQQHLFTWWDRIDQILDDATDSHADPTIHRLGVYKPANQ